MRRGTVSFTRNESYFDIRDLRFFNIDYRFITDLGGGDYSMVCCPTLRDTMTAGSLNAVDNIRIKTDTLVKSAYSTISHPTLPTDERLTS